MASLSYPFHDNLETNHYSDGSGGGGGGEGAQQAPPKIWSTVFCYPILYQNTWK